MTPGRIQPGTKATKPLGGKPFHSLMLVLVSLQLAQNMVQRLGVFWRYCVHTYKNPSSRRHSLQLPGEDHSASPETDGQMANAPGRRQKSVDARHILRAGVYRDHQTATSDRPTLAMLSEIRAVMTPAPLSRYSGMLSRVHSLGHQAGLEAWNFDSDPRATTKVYVEARDLLYWAPLYMSTLSSWHSGNSPPSGLEHRT
ncbi:uncharacterized protein MYCFIDRAFT_174570 [Pseudocercospora fijiensis CIRAD86]|uniref:Uncharacterized protein n=1 Tax=Pseudocercospora fijiensis (strain CIRAD86) TaxID=383855 RepID=M3B0X8_PSEFD|nr:uncharacterized protein MYCFIDRAFT_174570 [Pseudocercospora fijiensis CIRAD86]EME83092.1 hypothetical protein MYCFIDRAFT_174570 [Pseudocercospora fijiensis CIRAD86]